MISGKTVALLILLIFTPWGSMALSPNAQAVNLGGLELSGFSGLSGTRSYSVGVAPTDSSLNNTSMSQLNNTSIGPLNNTSINASINAPINASINTTSIDTTLKDSSVAISQPTKVLDLSRYASDRRKGDLTGFTNIMYPLAESRGSTTSTAGGGGCGCGGG